VRRWVAARGSDSACIACAGWLRRFITQVDQKAHDDPQLSLLFLLPVARSTAVFTVHCSLSQVRRPAAFRVLHSASALHPSRIRAAAAGMRIGEAAYELTSPPNSLSAATLHPHRRLTLSAIHHPHISHPSAIVGATRPSRLHPFPPQSPSPPPARPSAARVDADQRVVRPRPAYCCG
jgi:hypothetical protein